MHVFNDSAWAHVMSQHHRGTSYLSTYLLTHSPTSIYLLSCLSVTLVGTFINYGVKHVRANKGSRSTCLDDLSIEFGCLHSYGCQMFLQGRTLPPVPSLEDWQTNERMLAYPLAMTSSTLATASLWSLDYCCPCSFLCHGTRGRSGCGHTSTWAGTSAAPSGRAYVHIY